MTVSKTATGRFGGVGNADQDSRQSRLDGRPTSRTAKPDLRDARVRSWLKSAHRSWRSWARVAEVMGLSSKGLAQHVAEGRAPVTNELRRRHVELMAYRKAGQWLARRIK